MPDQSTLDFATKVSQLGLVPVLLIAVVALWKRLTALQDKVNEQQAAMIEKSVTAMVNVKTALDAIDREHPQ